jgi:hypothetical protein
LKNLKEQIKKLPENIFSRLTLENDDKVKYIFNLFKKKKKKYFFKFAIINYFSFKKYQFLTN